MGLERSTVGRGNSPFRDPANAGCRVIMLPCAAAEAALKLLGTRLTAVRRFPTLLLDDSL